MCNIAVFDVVFGVVEAISVMIDLLVSEVSAAEDIICKPCMSDNACMH